MLKYKKCLEKTLKYPVIWCSLKVLFVAENLKKLLSKILFKGVGKFR